MFVVVCAIGNQKYAIDLNRVERVYPAVEITPLPHAPDWILGAIRIHGDVFPVINTHKLLDLPPREIDIDDHLVLCRARDKKVLLKVDRVLHVKRVEEKNLEPVDEIMQGMEAVQFVVKEDVQITFVINLDNLLPSEAVPSVPLR